MKKITLLASLLFSGMTIGFAQEEELASDEQNSNITAIDGSAKTMLTANFTFDVSDTGVNSQQNEYGSGFFKTKYIIISAKKIGGLGGEKDPLTGEPYTQIYCSTIKRTGDLDRPLLYSRILNTVHNEGSITFTPSERTVYYTRSHRGDKRNYQLYRARDSKGKGQWLGEEKIPFSSENYSIENPYLSKDGKILYFSSNMPGGQGGYDLYYSKIHANGSLSDPVNLGPAVNTDKDEKTPFMDDNDKYVYFASSGHNSIGGLDVFRARRLKDGTYARVLNLGPTINSEEDDFAFILANSQRGYVTSAKANGVGGSDVYKVRMNRIEQSVRGTVIDAITNKELPGATVEVVDINGDVVLTKKVGKDAKFSFYVDPYESYTIKTKKEGYDNNTLPIETNSGTEKYFETTVAMNQTPPEVVEVEGVAMIKLENIYFDFDRASIKDQSKVSLEKLAKFLEENPEMKIEVNAHTDIRGSDSYNLRLSQRRAASTMKYLIGAGINKDRLVFNGFGETQPIIDCKSKECTDEEHELNRRIEFVIIQE